VRRSLVAWVVLVGAITATGFLVTRSDEDPPPPREAAPTTRPAPSPTPRWVEPTPINSAIAGLTTFRGNATRTYYGEGPVPKHPEVKWQYPVAGGLCSESADEEGTRLWCGTGWTGQPNVVEVEGRIEVRFGAFDRAVHVLDGTTGEQLKAPFFTGDLIKGTVTSDPDGYPLLYTGSRDNYLRVLALDRGDELVELWSLSSDSAPNPVWNNDWDGSPLVIGDYLLEGGENSWFYVVKLNRSYGDDGLVVVEPEIRMLVPGYDDQLLAELGDTEISIENSVAFDDGVVYFANSGGLVQGWRISRVLNGGQKHARVFRFWTGEDSDASIVIDTDGYLYVSSELERFNARGQEVGQLMKLDPTDPDDPLVWSMPIPGSSVGAIGGIWATPALHKGALFATTNSGRLLAVNRDTGTIAWELPLTAPAWSSPVVVDDKLIVADCGGTMYAYDVRRPLKGPPRELWQVELGACIESTPAVWKGMIYVGTRGGSVYGIGD
jgi:outer membrane protein assembly factor BamB